MKKSFKVVAIITSVFVLTNLGASAQGNSEESLNIQQPSNGTLSEAQLNKIAMDIRDLESNPYATDAKLARSLLFKWLTESPDVSVSVCPDVIGPLLNSSSKYKGELLSQYLLSSAAFVIENELESGKQGSAKTGGLRGALRTYAIFKDKEVKTARDEFMEKLSTLDKEGKLEGYVEKGIKKCR